MSHDSSKHHGEYSLGTPFARGSMGQLFTATHRLTGEPAVVKLPFSDQPLARDALSREIRALAALDHSGIVRLLSYGEEEGVPWLALPYLQGETLRELLSASSSDDGKRSSAPLESTSATIRIAERLAEPPLPVLQGPSRSADGLGAFGPAPLTLDEVRTLACHLLDALEHMHAEGIVHGDLKPENVIVLGRERPTLIDFGTSIRLAHSREDLLAAPKTVGTAAYLAPERLLSRGFDTRADYYALGCLLYEALSGKSPFARATVGATVLAQLRFEPPSLLSLGRGVPAAISQIVRRLLSKTPDDRPEFASEIREALGFSSTLGRPTSLQKHTLRRPELVGREAEIAIFSERLRAAREGHGGHVRLLGPSGSGKTRLAIVAADLAEKSGFEVIELSKEATVELERLNLSLLKARSQEKPIVLILDHLESVDSMSSARLRDLAGDSLSDHAVLVVWTSQSSSLLRPENVCDVRLMAHSFQETVQIAQSALGVESLSTQIKSRLYDVAAGNPGHLLHYLKLLIDERVLVHHDFEGWQLNRGVSPLERIKSGELRGMFERHLARLPDEVQKAARMAAILGRYFRLADLMALSETTEADATRLLAFLIQEHIAEPCAEELFRFVHPEYQALLRDACAEDRKKELHEKVSRLLAPLVAQYPELLVPVAEHLFECGEWQRAAECFLEAARRHDRSYEREVAASLVKSARRSLSNLPPSSALSEQLRALDEKLGDIYYAGRHLEDAAECFRAALDRHGPPGGAARILRKLSNASDRDKGQALAYLNEAIELLEGRKASGGTEQVEWIECHLAAMFIHYFRHETDRVLAIAAAVQRDVEEIGTPEQLASYHFNFAAGLLLHHRYAAEAEELSHIEKAVGLYEHLGDEPRMAMSRFMRSLILLCAGELEAADRGFSAILTAAEESASVTIQLRALTYLGLVGRMKGEGERVRRLATSALALSREHQMVEYTGTALANLAWVALLDGGRERCLRFSEEALFAWSRAPVVSPFTWTARLPWLAAQLGPDGRLLARPAELVEWVSPLLHETQQRPPEQVREATARLFESYEKEGVEVDEGEIRALAQALIDAARRVGWL